jgi:hypothetical protein
MTAIFSGSCESPETKNQNKGETIQDTSMPGQQNDGYPYNNPNSRREIIVRDSTAEKDSIIGKFYEQRKPKSVFYKQANFYSVNRIIAELRKSGFKSLQFSQTLFHGLDEIKEFERAKPGYGEGSFIMIKAIK